MAAREQAVRRKKPILLAIALVAMSLVGLHTVSEGFLAVEIVTDPFAGDALFPATTDAARDAANRAFVGALSDQARVALPIGIAQLLLGGLLLVASFRALFGKVRSTWFVLQLVAANAVLVVVGYVVGEPVRAAIVDAIVSGSLESAPPGVREGQLAEVLRSNGWWLFRVKLMVQIAVLGLAAVVLTRRSVRAAASAVESSEES